VPFLSNSSTADHPGVKKILDGINDSDGALIGRERELATVKSMVATLAQGRGGVLWIEGEAGLGKSALIRVLLAEADRLGFPALTATAHDLERQRPLGVITEALGLPAEWFRYGGKGNQVTGSVAEGDATGSGGTRLHATQTEWMEIIQRWINGAGVSELESCVAGSLALVARCCAAAPTLLVLDNLQWADNPSIQVWYILRRLTEQFPLLLVAATRPTPDRPEIASLRRSLMNSDAAIVSLRGLSTEQTTALVRHLLPHAPSPELLWIAGVADGNPEWVCAIVAACRQEYVATPRRSNASSGSSRHTGPPGLAESSERLIQAVLPIILERLKRRTPRTLPLLRKAALLGQDFTVASLAKVTGEPVVALLDRIDEALTCRVLVDDGERLRFTHPLLWRALYDSLPASVRAAATAAEEPSASKEKYARSRAVPQRVPSEGSAPMHGDPDVSDWMESPRDPKDATPGWEALTPAEMRVALLVAEGATNRHIAQHLFLSPRTVESHVSRILAKLGVRSRAGIIRIVAERRRQIQEHTQAG